MVTFPSGHIRVYDSINLHRQALLPCFNERSKVHSVECTCSQIIALYEEGSICSWAVKNGELTARIWVRGSGGGDDLPFRMRYINSKLVVATKEGTIHVYQYINSTFTRLGCWHVTGILVSRIEFDLYYVILQDVYTFAAQVYYPNGEFVQRIESNNVEAMAYHKGKLITGDKDQVLNIWEVRTGTLLHKLKGHNDAVDSIHIVEKNIVISGSHSSGVFTVWDLTKVLGRNLEKNDGEQGDTTLALIIIPSRKLVVSKNDDVQHPVFHAGRNFIIGRTKSGFRVIDFPCEGS